VTSALGAQGVEARREEAVGKVVEARVGKRSKRALMMGLMNALMK